MLDQIPPLLRRNSVISQFLTQQINTGEKESQATLSLTSFHIVSLTSFRGTSPKKRKEETYFLGNKPKGPVAGDLRLSACINTHKKELNTLGYNDIAYASSWLSTCQCSCHVILLTRWQKKMNLKKILAKFSIIHILLNTARE